LGLFVVTVIITDFPRSPFFGVYVKLNGDTVDEVGLTDPAPFSVIVTFVALPPKVFPVTATGVVPHVLPVALLRVTVGPFTHWPKTTVEINNKRKTKIKFLVIFYITNIH
jgi:hypothetical protein